jgi:hypothetical protein
MSSSGFKHVVIGSKFLMNPTLRISTRYDLREKCIHSGLVVRWFVETSGFLLFKCVILNVFRVSFMTFDFFGVLLVRTLVQGVCIVLPTVEVFFGFLFLKLC